MPRVSLLITCISSVILFSAPANAALFETEKVNLEVDQIGNFEYPWGMTFLSEHEAIVTERGGKIFTIDLSSGAKQEIANPPQSYVGGQGGLLDVATHPDFKQNGLVYFSHAFKDRKGSGTAVTFAKLSNNQSNQPVLSGHKTIFRSQPSSSDRHFGSRLVFAKDGTLFITIGDHGERPWAQEITKAAGSVIRIKDDGSIPADNPKFKGGLKGLWSIGHRNAQGAGLHPETGQLWTVEHGARGGDEINRPEAGKNYGWPTISYGRHYWGGKIGVGKEADGLEQPKYYWDPSIAPSGLSFYNGSLFPQWQNNLFIGALKDEMLVRLEMQGDKVVHEERLLVEKFGRIRDVRQGPKGALWLLTDDYEGKLLRITPSK